MLWGREKQYSGADGLKRLVCAGGYEVLYGSRSDLFRLVPELKDQEGYDLNQPLHCYDLLEHTLRVVEELPVDDPVLRVAGLLHDIGKNPETRGRKGEWATYYGHPKEGAKMSRYRLAQLGFPVDEVDVVRRLVWGHLINYHPKKWSEGAVRKFKGRNKDILVRLFQLVDADGRAQLPAEHHLDELKRKVGIRF